MKRSLLWAVPAAVLLVGGGLWIGLVQFGGSSAQTGEGETPVAAQLGAVTAAEAEDVIAADSPVAGHWLTYDDTFYRLRLRYPPSWEVTYGEEGPEPHGIRLEHFLSQADRAPQALSPPGDAGPPPLSPPGDAGPPPSPTTPNLDLVAESAAFITISPFLDAPLSYSMCPEPVSARLAGRPASICSYVAGETYPNFRLIDLEWAVLSLTLHLEEGPVYVTLVVGAPRIMSPSDDVVRALRAEELEALAIVASLELY